MNPPEDTRERVIVLEVKVTNLEGKLEKACQQIDEMYGVLMQAKGARYVIAAGAGIAGAIAGFLTKFIPFSGGLPK